MKKYRSKVSKSNSDLDKAYRQLFGPTDPASCAVCGDAAIDDLAIYPSDDGNRAWKILCRVCYTTENNTITQEEVMS